MNVNSENGNDIIFGVDPGTHKCGYSLFKGGKPVAYGSISTYSKDLVVRIKRIKEGMTTVLIQNGLLDLDGEPIENFTLAWETPYSGTGAGSAGKSGMQHVWMIIGMLCTIPASKYLPLHVATVQATWGRKRTMDRNSGKLESVRLANLKYGLELDVDDSDTADAIWVGATAIRCPAGKAGK